MSPVARPPSRHREKYPRVRYSSPPLRISCEFRRPPLKPAAGGALPAAKLAQLVRLPKDGCVIPRVGVRRRMAVGGHMRTLLAQALP